MSETKMTTAQKLAQVRAEAREIVSIPEDSYKIGADTYVVVTPSGNAKVAISAVKDENFDPAFEAEQYALDLAQKAEKAEKVKADKEAAKLAKEAKKAEKA